LSIGHGFFLTRASPAIKLPLPRIRGEGWGEGDSWAGEALGPLTLTLSPDAGAREPIDA
jgi:hypothetical protein